METAIETNNNDEINVLRIKLEIVEKELQLAINRAEKAENEVEILKNDLYKNIRHVEIALPVSTQNTAESTSMTMSSSAVCTHCGQSFLQSTVSNASAELTSMPPPPPPPMPNFKPIPVNLNQCGASLKDGITTFTLNNLRESGDNISICSNPDMKKSATGRFINILQGIAYALAVNVCVCACE